MDQSIALHQEIQVHPAHMQMAYARLALFDGYLPTRTIVFH